LSNHHAAPDGSEKEHGLAGLTDPGPYWKRMHRDWRFWTGAVLMAAAVVIYVMTLDLSTVPHQ